jgi:hypothetical protein
VYPSFDHGVLPSVYSFNPARPAWVDELITPLLVAERGDLPSSASVFLDRLKIFKDQQLSAQLAPVLVEHEKQPEREQRDGLTQVKLSTVLGAAQGLAAGIPVWKRVSLRSRSTVVVVGVCVLVALLVGGAVVDSVRARAKRQIALEANPGDVALDDMVGAGWEGQQRQLQKMFASEDPLAHDALLRLLRTVTEPEARDYIVDGLLSRSQRMGLALSAEQVGTWKRKLKGPIPSGALLERLLRIVDPLVPAEARVQLLTELYAEQPTLAMRLALAASLDLGSSEPYRVVVVRGSKESGGIRGGEKRSLFALALAVPDLANAFLDSIRPHISRIPDEDIAWLVTQLSVTNTSLAYEMAGVLIARQVVTGPRSLFLRELEPSAVISASVRAVLVSCAMSGPTRNDLPALASWSSPSAARVLALVALTAEDEQVVATAFDIMAAKPTTSTSVANILSAVRGTSEVNKAQAARIVASVMLDAKLSDEDISKAVAGVDLSEEWGVVVRALLDAHADRVVVELLHRYGDSLDTELLFEILEQGRPKVKISAIEVLSRSEDVGIRRRALELYPEEKEPDVIAAYERHLKDK